MAGPAAAESYYGDVDLIVGAPDARGSGGRCRAEEESAGCAIRHGKCEAPLPSAIIPGLPFTRRERLMSSIIGSFPGRPFSELPVARGELEAPEYSWRSQYT